MSCLLIGRRRGAFVYGQLSSHFRRVPGLMACVPLLNTDSIRQHSKPGIRPNDHRRSQRISFNAAISACEKAARPAACVCSAGWLCWCMRSSQQTHQRWREALQLLDVPRRDSQRVSDRCSCKTALTGHGGDGAAPGRRVSRCSHQRSGERRPLAHGAGEGWVCLPCRRDAYYRASIIWAQCTIVSIGNY